MRRLRLLGVTNFYPPAITGGYGEIAADVMRGLAARGHRTTMLVAAGSGGDGVDVRPHLRYVLGAWRRPLSGLRALVHDETIVRAALREGVDAALVWHMRGIVKPPLRLLHDAGVPVLYMLHDGWVVYERPGGPSLLPWATLERHGVAAAREAAGRVAARWLEVRAPPIASEGIACFVSRWLRDEYARLGWRARHERIVPAGVDVDAIGALRTAPARVPPERAVFAARIHPTKGLDVAVRALALTDVPVRLTVAGPLDDRRYLERVRALGRDLGVAERVDWRGELSRRDVLQLLASHDVLVAPSRTPETFGLSIAEALAAGTVVVTSAVGGPREYLEHERNALLFEPEDAAALAALLERLAGEPSLAGSLTGGARATAEGLSLRAVLDRVEAVLAEVVRRRS